MCDGAWRRCHSGEEQGGGGCPIHNFDRPLCSVHMSAWNTHWGGGLPTLNSKPDITHSNIGLVTQYVFRKR